MQDPRIISSDSNIRANQRLKFAAQVEEFYNKCHGKGGKFCGGGPGGSNLAPDVKITGKADSATISNTGKKETVTLPSVKNAKVWPESGGRPVTTIAKVKLGSVVVDRIRSKAVYEVTAKNGNKIRLYDQSGKAGPYEDSLLQNHAKMNEMYPLTPPRNIVVLPLNSPLMGPHTIAHVRSGIPLTFVNSKYLGVDVKNPHGFYMPSSQNGDTKNMDYLMTHEYGHHLDLTKNVDPGTFRATYKVNPLMKNRNFYDNLSRYGKAHEVEAYAEAFAEWHHSEGQTKNPASIALARSEGWYGSGSSKAVKLSLLNNNLLTFALEDPSIIENKDQPGISITDNFEKDPKISGNYTSIPPTKEEISAADILMNEVMRELGIFPDPNASETF